MPTLPLHLAIGVFLEHRAVLSMHLEIQCHATKFSPNAPHTFTFMFGPELWRNVNQHSKKSNCKAAAVFNFKCGARPEIPLRADCHPGRTSLGANARDVSHPSRCDALRCVVLIRPNENLYQFEVGTESTLELYSNNQIMTQ